MWIFLSISRSAFICSLTSFLAAAARYLVPHAASGPKHARQDLPAPPNFTLILITRRAADQVRTSPPPPSYVPASKLLRLVERVSASTNSTQPTPSIPRARLSSYPYQFVGVDESWIDARFYIVMEEEPAYQPKDAIQASIKTTLITGSAGLLFAAVQNTLTRQNIGAFGVFTKFGGTIGLFGWEPGNLQKHRSR